jgi:hypothetical protein
MYLMLFVSYSITSLLVCRMFRLLFRNNNVHCKAFCIQVGKYSILADSGSTDLKTRDTVPAIISNDYYTDSEELTRLLEIATPRM